MKKRRAFITGATGQDGTYLTDYLISLGYEVYGIGNSKFTPHFCDMHYSNIDVRDTDRLVSYLHDILPDECYHLAASHHSSASDSGHTHEKEIESINTNFISTHTILYTLTKLNRMCRIFLAGSCHMFGNTIETPQSERTPFIPNSIYGITKTASAQLGRMYREQQDMFVCNGILYNHESPLRGRDFVTARIAAAAVDILRGNSRELVLGNLDAMVDWGFAGDYVRAMHLMLQAENPEDFLIASGELHSVRDFVKIAFEHVGLDWTLFVREDVSAYRPLGRAVYHGDSSAIRERLGWKPKTSFKELVIMMVDYYLNEVN